MVKTPAPQKGVSSYTVNRSYSSSRIITNASGVATSSEPSNILSAYNGQIAGRTSNKVRKIGSVTWKPMSSYSRSGWVITRTSGLILVNHRTGTEAFRQTGPSLNSQGPTFVSRHFLTDGTLAPLDAFTKARLDTELLLKVGSKKADYGAELGEAKSTLAHLCHTAKSVIGAYKAARKGDFGGVARSLGVSPKHFRKGSPASSRWLEYQFAWLPMLGTIKDSADLISNGFRDQKMIAKSVRNLTDYTSGSDKVVAGDRKWVSTRRDTAMVYYRVGDNVASTLHSLGLINPLSVAWELTPYSFLVDWFMPVGNFLEALTATLGVTFIDGCYSSHGEMSLTLSNMIIPSTFALQPEKVIANTPTVVTEASGYRRSKMTGFPVPKPYFKNPFSTNHVISTLALIRQLQR